MKKYTDKSKISKKKNEKINKERDLLQMEQIHTRWRIPITFPFLFSLSISQNFLPILMISFIRVIYSSLIPLCLSCFCPSIFKFNMAGGKNGCQDREKKHISDLLKVDKHAVRWYVWWFKRSVSRKSNLESWAVDPCWEFRSISLRSPSS